MMLVRRARSTPSTAPATAIQAARKTPNIAVIGLICNL
jgi:hypothetical protein